MFATCTDDDDLSPETPVKLCNVRQSVGSGLSANESQRLPTGKIEEGCEIPAVCCFSDFDGQLWHRKAADQSEAHEKLPQLSPRPRRRSKRGRRIVVRASASASETEYPWRRRSMGFGDGIELNRCGKVTSRWRHRSLCARRRDEIAIIIIGGLTSPTRSLSLCNVFPYFRISCVGYKFTCVSQYVQLGLRVCLMWFVLDLMRRRFICSWIYNIIRCKVASCRQFNSKHIFYLKCGVDDNLIHYTK